MSLEQLPINFFDAVVIVVLLVGIAQGRKRGMSEELLSLIQWLAILFGCAAIYEPTGEMIRQLTGIFGRLSCYLLAYVGVGLLVVLVFAGIKRTLGGKLIGSDIFGRSEYYLGMASGLVRSSSLSDLGNGFLARSGGMRDTTLYDGPPKAQGAGFDR